MKKILMIPVALLLPATLFAAPVSCPPPSEVETAIQSAIPLQQIAVKAKGVEGSWYSLGRYSAKANVKHLEEVYINTKDNPKQTACIYALASGDDKEKLILFLSTTDFTFVKMPGSTGSWSKDGSACFVNQDDPASCAFTMEGDISNVAK